MNVTKCVNGHYFDADKYQACPHCGAAIGNGAAGKSTKTENMGVFGKKDTESRVEMHPMPDRTQGKTFGVFDDELAPQPRPFEAETKKCPACGSEVPQTAKFCRMCGNKLDEPAIPAAGNTGVFAGQRPEPAAPETKQTQDTAEEEEKTQQIFETPASPAPNGNMGARPTAPLQNRPMPGAVSAPNGSMGTRPTAPLQNRPMPGAVSAPNGNMGARPTAPLQNRPPFNGSTPPSVQTGENEKATLESQIRRAVAGSEGKTVGFFSMGDTAEESCDPVVGWLVCVKGSHLGESFVLAAGRNSVGRGSANHVVLAKDNAVSREKQAWIVYDPKYRRFYVQPGESSGLTYVNGETVMGSKELKAKDMLDFGSGTYMLVPLCGEDFSWEEYIKGSQE